MSRPDLTPPSLQQRSLVAWIALTVLHQDWRQKLVLLDAAPESEGLAFAARIAGAAVLWTDPDSASLRIANQTGLTDFNVTTLSEAIRILRNEVRKGAPACVGLADEQGILWHAAAERGLQPHALLATRQANAQVAKAWLGRGALDLAGMCPPNASLADLRESRAGNWRERHTQDEVLLNHVQRLTGLDRLRAAHWLHAAPRLFPRDLDRWYLDAWSASNPA